MRRLAGDFPDAVLVWQVQARWPHVPHRRPLREVQSALDLIERSNAARSRRVSIGLRGGTPPKVLEYGADDAAEWLVTAALDGDTVGDTLARSVAGGDRGNRRRGLRAIHALPVGEFPAEVGGRGLAARQPATLGPRPPILDPVDVVHGDA